MKIKLGEVLNKQKKSVAQLARLLEVEPKQLSRLFKEDANPRIKEIMKWAELLNVKVKDLLEDDGSDIVTITRPRTATESIELTERRVKEKENKIKKKIMKNK